MDIETGFRKDQISWKSIIPSPQPILKDNLDIDQIHIFQIGVNAETLIDYNILLKAKANYGWILDGDVKESLKTINPDTSLMESLTDHHMLDGRFVADLSIGIGYPCYFCDCSLSINPLLGYAYSTQSFIEDRNRRNFFDLNESLIPSLDFIDTCAHYKYVYRWYGPWLGLNLVYSPDCCLDLYAQFEYHFAHFSGKRESSIHFQPIDEYNHTTHHAHGSFFKMGINYLFSHCMYVGFNISYQDWKSRRNINIKNALSSLGLSTNDPEMSVKNNWRSAAYSITIGSVY